MLDGFDLSQVLMKSNKENPNTMVKKHNQCCMIFLPETFVKNSFSCFGFKKENFIRFTSIS